MPKFHIQNLWVAAQSYFKSNPQTYVPEGKSLAQCEKCFSLVMANAGVGLMNHLAEDHGMSQDHSKETLAWVTVRVYRHKLRGIDERSSV
jgi:hypothetical protein